MLLIKGRRSLHGSINFRGLDIAIENQKSSARAWKNPDDGSAGMSYMRIPYGYIRGTMGVDGDAVDVYVGPHRDAPMVYIVHQTKAPDFKGYDEDKCMVGFLSAAEAKAAYLKQYNDPRFFGAMTEMPFEEFRVKVLATKGKPQMIKSLTAPRGHKAFTRRSKTGKVEQIQEKAGPGRFFTEQELRAKAREVKPPQVGLTGFTESQLRQIATERGLKVPPAWTDLWVNKDPHAGLQVKGRDKTGVLQRIYSARHSESSAVAKFERVKSFAKVYPQLMRQIREDMDTSEEARVLYLIAKTGFRLGSDKERGAEKAHGASNLRAEHVQVKGNTVSFGFVGKKGVDIRQKVTDEQVAQMFKIRPSKGGRFFSVTEHQVRGYLNQIGYGQFLVKDFRTHLANEVALAAIKKIPVPTDAGSHKKAVKAVCEAVAARLGNTWTVARAAYISPEVFSKWTV